MAPLLLPREEARRLALFCPATTSRRRCDGGKRRKYIRTRGLLTSPPLGSVLDKCMLGRRKAGRLHVVPCTPRGSVVFTLCFHDTKVGEIPPSLVCVVEARVDMALKTSCISYNTAHMMVMYVSNPILFCSSTAARPALWYWHAYSSRVPSSLGVLHEEAR